MVNTIRPTFRSAATASTNKVRESSQVDESSDDKEVYSPYVVNRDRRKKQDRRKKGALKRSVYDMRSGKDRRKSSPESGSIEIKV